MEALLKEYQSTLDSIKEEIQNSEELTAYLDEEGEEEYKALIEKFENKIHDVYVEVANQNPLQIIALENYLLNNDFEGLYLPKALGYTVLRGRIDDNYNYDRPQQQFKKALEFIIASSNFDQIKQRVGQSIQIGFALSSDIWITNIINSVNNKQVKSFLDSQNMLKYHDIRNRKTAYIKYSKQFQSLNFYTADFPSNTQELFREFNLLKSFLLYRSSQLADKNGSLMSHISTLIKSHDNFNRDSRFVELLLIISMKFDLPNTDISVISTYFNELRSRPGFEEKFFNMMVRLHSEIRLDPIAEKRLVEIFDKSQNDKVSELYKVLDIIHGSGYMNEDAINATREFYYSNEGLSPQNTCIRNSIFFYFQELLKNLDVADYSDYFEINKIMVQYINIFDNQQFNQDIKDTSLRYIKKLLKHYTDKRGRDYQDIKKYVWATFMDLNFMSEKELKEQFKTKRKAKPTA